MASELRKPRRALKAPRRFHDACVRLQEDLGEALRGFQKHLWPPACSLEDRNNPNRAVLLLLNILFRSLPLRSVPQQGFTLAGRTYGPIAWPAVGPTFLHMGEFEKQGAAVTR
eukprot:2072156-Pyramimonas_sp.AAC.1